MVVSCEHAGNAVPPNYRDLFRSRKARAALASHRGWDAGSLEMGRRLAQAFDASLIVNHVSRLVVEVNRSRNHPRLYSEFTREAADRGHAAGFESIYDGHRDGVETAIRSALRSYHTVLHVGSHSFTPRLNGETRNADVGLLYDPQRAAEKSLCTRWAAAMREHLPDLRVRRNYPYLGKSDGLTTYLRRKLGTSRYLGIELEVNQALLSAKHTKRWRDVQRCIVESLRDALTA